MMLAIYLYTLRYNNNALLICNNLQSTDNNTKPFAIPYYIGNSDTTPGNVFHCVGTLHSYSVLINVTSTTDLC